MSKHLTRLHLAAAAMIAFPTICTAYPLPTPMRLYIPEGISHASIKLTNESDSPATFYLDIREWHQSPKGDATLVDTRDIAIDLSQVNLGPHKSTMVNVLVLNHHLRTGIEKTYRLVMKGTVIPATSTTNETRATFDMPVFVGSPPVGAKLALSKPYVKNNMLHFDIKNNGQRVGRPDGVKIYGSKVNGDTLFKIERPGWYVFPNSYLSYIFSISDKDCAYLSKIKIIVGDLTDDLSDNINWQQKVCSFGIDNSDFRRDEVITKSIAQHQIAK